MTPITIHSFINSKQFELHCADTNILQIVAMCDLTSRTIILAEEPNNQENRFSKEKV